MNKQALPIDETLATVWLIFHGVFVFFMQSGFAMLESGTVGQPTNIKSIMFKNLVDICLSAVFFWLFGFAFAYGSGDVVGTEYFAGTCLDKKFTADACEGAYGYVEWFFQFTFAATSATIVSGAVAERAQFVCYIVYSSCVSGVVYPLAAHWMWGGGFLETNGTYDHAGAAVVHMTGGMAALVGAVVLGARTGRFEGQRFDVTVHDKGCTSATHVGLGTLILWAGWYSFNIGSTLSISGSEETAGRIALNTTLAGAFGGLASLALTTLLSYRRLGREGYLVSFESLTNGIMMGLVSVTAGCAVFTPGTAVATAVVAGAVFVGGSNLLVNLKIDDPLNASVIHLFGGAWGMVAVGLFAREAQATNAGLSDYGVLEGGSGDLLLWQLIGVAVIGVWSAASAALVFGLLSRAGYARVSAKAEEMGLDEHFRMGKDRQVNEKEKVMGFVLTRLEDELAMQRAHGSHGGMATFSETASTMSAGKKLTLPAVHYSTQGMSGHGVAGPHEEMVGHGI